MPLREVMIERIRAGGPLTFAEYMAQALYNPEQGYYARAVQRSGRTGDFFTSVDVGPLFGELLTRQFAEMWRLMDAAGAQFDLVEAGAGSGRLARDVLEAAATLDREFYDAVRLHLVELSPLARSAQQATLGPHAQRLASSGPTLPERIVGVIFANELLDALPTHVVRMSHEGLKEMYVDFTDGDRLAEREGPISTPAISEYFARVGVTLDPGARAEVCLAAADWVRSAARQLDRGFLVLIDYGHPAAELFSPSHGSGTLTTYRAHHVGAVAGWLNEPGEHDLTAHVDLTTVEESARVEGLEMIARLDQTYFLLGLGAAERLGGAPEGIRALKERLAVKTLVMPGGLGSTHKVLIFGKGVGRPALKGTSYRERLT